MSQSSDRAGTPGSGSAEQPSRLGHLLAVWVLVGYSLIGLGWDLYRALVQTHLVSAIGAGLLFGTVTVVALWLGGFRPSIRASATYFLSQLGIHLLLAVVSAGVTLRPWRAVAIRLLSIAIAAAFSFTAAGSRSREWLRQRTRSVLKLPE